MAETCTSIKFVQDFQIKPTETSDLLQTPRDTSELKHTTVFNDVQSVSHNEIAFKNNKEAQKSTQITLTSWHAPYNPSVCCRNCHKKNKIF